MFADDAARFGVMKMSPRFDHEGFTVSTTGWDTGRYRYSTLGQVLIENRISRADLWEQAMLYTEMMYGWKFRKRKEDVRRSWYYRNGYWGDYVAKLPVGPVPLTFSLWEQVEARHKDDALLVETAEEREDRQRAEAWLTSADGKFKYKSTKPIHGRVDEDFLMKLTGDEWVETKTLDAKSEAWKPQGTLYVSSGRS
jgi:hypothetical protein